MIKTENYLWERDVSADFHEAMNQMRAEPAPTDSVDRFLMTAARLNESGTLTTDRQPNSGGSKKSNLVSTQNGPVSNRAFFTGRATMITLKTLAAAVLVIGGIAWFEMGNGTLSPVAFADVLPGVDNVTTMTWTTTAYLRASTKDGKLIGIGRSRHQTAYRHPGQYRETRLDEDGVVNGITITDYRVNRILVLDVKKKKAVLKTPSHPGFLQSPFAFVGDVIRDREIGSDSLSIKSVAILGKKEFEMKQVNVVQAIIKSLTSENQMRHDYLFDADSKQLVGTWRGNEIDFDYESAAELKDWKIPGARVTIVGGLDHEINLKPILNASDFSLDPPAGYDVEKIAAPTVTEDEVIAYLAAAAQFNGNKLPDSPYAAYDREKLNDELKKDESLRSAEVTGLIEQVGKFKLREIYSPPIRRFVDDHTSPESFHYVGSGVALGEADRIVCWYRLRNAKTYRAIYGDLSARDIAESDLPLKLSR
jgi:hypothetical protein